VEEIGRSKKALHLLLVCGENHFGYSVLAGARETPTAWADFIAKESYKVCSNP
jgi:hypothetical protein